MQARGSSRCASCFLRRVRRCASTFAESPQETPANFPAQAVILSLLQNAPLSAQSVGTDSPIGRFSCLEIHQPPRRGSSVSSSTQIVELMRNAVPEQCSVYDAARVLGISSEEVLELCVAGTLDAHQVRGRYWLIDEDSLAEFIRANPPSQPEDAPCPPLCCEAHWSRRARIVPEFRVGLCRRCFSGMSLPVKGDTDPDHW